MKGLAFSTVPILAGFFYLVIYPDLEYSGTGGGHSCYGECYKEYVRVNGTPAQIEA